MQEVFIRRCLKNMKIENVSRAEMECILYELDRQEDKLLDLLLLHHFSDLRDCFNTTKDFFCRHNHIFITT